MYLIIDEDYRISKTNIISGNLRSECRKGNISIVDVKNMKGMNALSSIIPCGLQSEFGENEWSDIQDLEDVSQ